MKQIEIFFRTFFLIAFMLLTNYPALLKSQDFNVPDSVEISLITCSPHEEIYSLYGHTAIRYHELNTGRDIIFNYGIFNFKAPHFVLRFILGMTDYELGVSPTNSFCQYYQRWGSMITEQVLNLTPEEKRIIINALAENLKPENRVYRYNFLYDNCSTRPRDIIERSLNGKLIYKERTDYHPTYREMIHEMNAQHPWAALGNDLLLGVKADMKTTRSQQEFLPKNLQHDFEDAQIYSNGTYKPLVKEHRILVKPGIQFIEKDFIFSPTECAILFLIFTFCIFLIERKRGRRFIWFDTLIMLTVGITGCIIFLMFFSEHPTTSTNLQIFLLNPLPLFFIPSIIRRKPTRYWNMSLLFTVLFLIGSIWQDYAEGMEILALCLLIRYWSHFKNDK